jgi:hypothetical protein
MARNMHELAKNLLWNEGAAAAAAAVSAHIKSMFCCLFINVRNQL